MATQLVTLDNAAIPAHIASRIGKESKLSVAMAGGISSGGGPRISIKGGRFRVVEDGTEEVIETVDLNAVIVGANPRLSKTFYLKPWTPDAEPTNPDCYSMDGVRPDAGAPSPQHAQCVDCQHNAWGSKITPNGQQVKACVDQKRLAVVSFDNVSGPVYLLQVPPASLKGLNGYHKELSRRGIPPEVVATRISFDTDASHPKLQFNFGGFLNPEQQAVVDKLFGAEAVLEVTGEKLITIPEPAAPVPKLALQVPAPVVKAVPIPTPAPVAQPVAAQPAVAAKKRGFGGVGPVPVPPVQPAIAAAPTATVITADSQLSELEREIAAMVNGVADDAAIVQ